MYSEFHRRRTLSSHLKFSSRKDVWECKITVIICLFIDFKMPMLRIKINVSKFIHLIHRCLLTIYGNCLHTWRFTSLIHPFLLLLDNVRKYFLPNSCKILKVFVVCVLERAITVVIVGKQTIFFGSEVEEITEFVPLSPPLTLAWSWQGL